MTQKTGYPSIDRPWLKYYSEEELRIQVPEMSLTDYLYQQNKGNLSLPAIIYMGKQITYREMFEQIERASRFFLKLGVKKDDNVVIALPLVPEVIYMIYGLDNIGAVANLIDPRIPTERMQYYINLSSAKIGCIISTYIETMVEAQKDTSLQTIISVSPMDSLSKDEKRAFFKENYTLRGRLMVLLNGAKGRIANKMQNNMAKQNGDYLLIMNPLGIDDELPELRKEPYVKGKVGIVEYTSGTTGVPKGLELTASGMNVTAAQITTINKTVPGESILGIMPPFISYGAVTGLHMSLSAGFAITLIPKFSVDEFAKLVKTIKPNNIICVPSMFAHVIDSPLMINEDLSYLKRLIFGGDRTTPDYENRVNDWLRDHNTDIKLIKGGGMAEFSSCLFETPFEETKKPGIYGIPMPLVEAKVMKDDYTECVYGEIGEIYVSSPQQMKGYVNSIEETEKFFFVDGDGKRWGRTGDLGYVDENGAFTLTGRKKHMIIRPDGHNVFPAEIENAIMASGFAEECVVIGVKDSSSVIGEYPFAFIQLKANLPDSDEMVLREIIERVKRDIPVRDRPPRDEDYLITQIPYSEEGKIDYRALEAMARGENKHIMSK